jgi:hypothetical protein
MSEAHLAITPGLGAASGAGADDPVDTETAGFRITPEHEAHDVGTVAARMRAKRDELRHRSKDFPVPPEDVWGGDLVLRARAADVRAGMTNVGFVGEATAAMLVRDEKGELRPVEDVPGSGGTPGWAGVGRLMGIVTDANASGVSEGDVILAVCSSSAIVGALADTLVAWVLGRKGLIEQALGG